ncbi:MAG: hypothetical protein A2X64_07925 [Ignavibacteria bacterium GWF2_33_9]|nr:MAG: hypothetical protein A2X64_07925 [Ignavibacteria bacterium GWF2_33_9]
MYEWRKIWNPEWFQGSRRKEKYFEGWYFKNVSQSGEYCWSFIPGVSLVGENAHSFIQAINGKSGETYYFRFPAEDFSFSNKGFEVRIADNYFSEKGFSLNLDDGKNKFSGSISISDKIVYKATLRRPGIMGWYRYMPFMECYHGVVSLDHRLDGEITFNGGKMDFSNGRGYIEKDWGTSMPSSWIWMQTNHFQEAGTSFMLSVARIPWIRRTFTGFLGFFHHNGKTITFATYTGAIISELEYSQNTVNIIIKANNYLIEIYGKNKSNGALKAPVFGEMDRVIHESIDASIRIRVLSLGGNLIYEGKGESAGMEMVGNLSELK